MNHKLTDIAAKTLVVEEPKNLSNTTKREVRKIEAGSRKQFFLERETYEIFAITTEMRLPEEGGRKFVPFYFKDVLLFHGTFSGLKSGSRHEYLFVLLLDLLLQMLMNLLMKFVIELVAITGRFVG